MSKNIEKKNNNNLVKKILFKIKENLISEEIKNEIKNELFDPLYLELRNFILPHYITFMFLFSLIIIFQICLLFVILNKKNN